MISFINIIKVLVSTLIEYHDTLTIDFVTIQHDIFIIIITTQHDIFEVIINT